MESKVIFYCIIVLLIGACLGYATYHIMNLNSIEHNPNWASPPSLSDEPQNYEEVIEDLESIDCIVVKEVFGFGHFGNYIRIEDYSEFRRVAFNTKIVFFKNTTNSYEDSIYTIFDGVFISYHD